MGLKRGQVYLAVLIASIVVALVAGVPMVGDPGLGRVLLVFLAGGGVGAGVTGIATAMQRELTREAPARATGRRARPDRQRSAKRSTTPRKRKQDLAQSTTGKVKWFDETKGFGFITIENGETDYFVHRSSIQGGNSLPEGKKVEFEIVDDDRGRKAATNVRTVQE